MMITFDERLKEILKLYASDTASASKAEVEIKKLLSDTENYPVQVSTLPPHFPNNLANRTPPSPTIQHNPVRPHITPTNVVSPIPSNSPISSKPNSPSPSDSIPPSTPSKVADTKSTNVVSAPKPTTVINSPIPDNPNSKGK
jgi:hypothetical protein